MATVLRGLSGLAALGLILPLSGCVVFESTLDEDDFIYVLSGSRILRSTSGCGMTLKPQCAGAGMEFVDPSFQICEPPKDGKPGRCDLTVRWAAEGFGRTSKSTIHATLRAKNVESVEECDASFKTCGMSDQIVHTLNFTKVGEEMKGRGSLSVRLIEEVASPVFLDGATAASGFEFTATVDRMRAGSLAVSVPPGAQRA